MKFPATLVLQERQRGDRTLRCRAALCEGWTTAIAVPPFGHLTRLERAVGRIYDLYERHVFPLFLDLGMRPLHAYREKTLAAAEGQVLEIGFGTGLNLGCYSSRVKRLIGVDPMHVTRRNVKKRIAEARFPVEHHALPADGGLPFGDESFDCVVTTWTLCTIAQPAAALHEMRRVARPGAQLLFIEHGRSDDPAIARWQDRLNGVQRLIGCGCNLNRPMDRLIEAAGFRLEQLERFDAPRMPRTHAHMYRGMAVA